MRRSSKAKKSNTGYTIKWWCRICWYRGKTDVDFDEIEGFTMEGIRLKIEGVHRTVCEKGEVKIG